MICMNVNMRLIAFIFFIIAPTWAVAVVYDNSAKLSDFGTINVAIKDNANDGCWTNISETRSYAVGKLEEASATVSVDRSNERKFIMDKETTFSIEVNALRTGGFCFGNFSFQYSISDL